MRPAAGIILHRQGSLFLARRSGRVPFLPGFFVFPGGAAEKGESLEQAARRELQEETGVELPQGLPMTPCGVFRTPSYSNIRFQAQFYLCECPADLEPVVDGKELVEGRWLSAQGALELWAQGEFPVAPPTLATLRALARDSLEEAAATLQARVPGNGMDTPEFPLCDFVSYLPLPTKTLPPAAHTLSYLVGEERYWVIDPGSTEVEPLLEVMNHWEARGKRLEGILLTHHHPDHIGGVEALDLPVVCHPATAERLPFPVERTLEEGDVLELGRGLKLEALHTPGHAPGHLCFFEPEKRWLFAGDTVSSISSIMIAAPDGDLVTYLETLRRLERLDAQMVLPAHGPPLGPGSAPFTKMLKHRRRREEKLLEALEQHSTELELLEVVYDDLPREFRYMAHGPLQAQLDKLQREGQVVQDGSAWRKSAAPHS